MLGPYENETAALVFHGFLMGNWALISHSELFRENIKYFEDM